jgi:hypothetical protein
MKKIKKRKKLNKLKPSQGEFNEEKILNMIENSKNFELVKEIPALKVKGILNKLPTIKPKNKPNKIVLIKLNE